MNQLPITIRKFKAEDESFVYHSWLETYLDALSDMKVLNGLRSDVYYKGQHKRIEELLSRCTTLIACNNEDIDQIYGWICFETLSSGQIFHFMYVKQPFRKNGIAKMLIEEARDKNEKEVFYTHKTPFTKEIIKYFQRSVFNPYLVEVYK